MSTEDKKPTRTNIAIKKETHARLKMAAGESTKLQGFTDDLINNALDMRERYQRQMVTQ